MLAQTPFNGISLCSLCLCAFFALRCAGQSPADDWDTLRGKLDVFQSTGEFKFEGGASAKGKFRWANKGQKYFLDLNFVEKKDDAPDRLTLLSDGEKVAQCIFSSRLSKGCQVKVFDHKSAASENTATQYFLHSPMSGPDNFLPPAVRKALSKDGTRGEFKADNSTWIYRLSPENGHALEELLLVDEQGAIQVIEKQVMSPNSATVFGLTSKSYEAYDRSGQLRVKHVLTFDSFEIGKTDQAFTFDQLEVPAGSRIVVNDGASHEVRIVRPPSHTQTKGKSIRQVIDGPY